MFFHTRYKCLSLVLGFFPVFLILIRKFTFSWWKPRRFCLRACWGGTAALHMYDKDRKNMTNVHGKVSTPIHQAKEPNILTCWTMFHCFFYLMHKSVKGSCFSSRAFHTISFWVVEVDFLAIFFILFYRVIMGTHQKPFFVATPLVILRNGLSRYTLVSTCWLFFCFVV